MDHLSDNVSGVDVDCDESTDDATDEFRQLSSHQLSQFVEFLGSRMRVHHTLCD